MDKGAKWKDEWFDFFKSESSHKDKQRGSRDWSWGLRTFINNVTVTHTQILSWFWHLLVLHWHWTENHCNIGQNTLWILTFLASTCPCCPCVNSKQWQSHWFPKSQQRFRSALRTCLESINFRRVKNSIAESLVHKAAHIYSNQQPDSKKAVMTSRCNTQRRARFRRPPQKKLSVHFSQKDFIIRATWLSLKQKWLNYS